MKWSRTLILPVALLLALSACGGAGDSGGNGGSSEGAQASASTDSQASTEESAAASEGNGNSAGDLDSLVEALTPPNSSEISKTTAEGGAFIAWSSTDSVDSLKGFYEGAIADAGMHIFSTTSTSGAYAWVFAESEGSSHGGSVTVAPASDGTNGSSIVLTITE
jgi:hypothetical protein